MRSPERISAPPAGIQAITDDFVGENCYVVWDSELRATIIDPGLQAQDVQAFIGEHGLVPGAILITHGHMDHTAGVTVLRDRYQVPVHMHPGEEVAWVDGTNPWQGRAFGFQPPPFSPDRALTPGVQVSVGDLVYQVLFTPGHSPTHVTFRLLDDLFSGDCLFENGVGRTDLLGGDTETLLRSIREVLFSCGDDCRVLSGHGAPTTILRERRTNPFLRD
ncbi:MAG: MBL fold metallo-hydrolase [Candidatus Dormibacteria bacterium]